MDVGVKKILIVEDNALNMKLFNDVLEAQGFQTIKSTTGLDVMDLCKEHKPDLIILDIQLPRISGLEIIAQIRGDEDVKNMRVIAISAFAMHEDEVKILSSGCDAYLSKPISLKSFLDCIQSYLHSAAA